MSANLPTRDEGALSSSEALEAALDQQRLHLEQIIVRAETVIAVFGMLIGAFIFARISASLGARLTLVGASFAAYFSIAYALLKRGRGLRFYSTVNPLLEGSIGTGIVLIDLSTQDALFAASAPGILIYCLFAPLSVLRLRPALPVLVGLVGAVEYGLVYALAVHPRLRLHPFTPAVGPDMAFVRATLIAISGIAGTAVSIALRNAVGRATTEVRANDLFGKYTIGARIASGGMGAVFRATYCPEGGFKRPVALKKIHPHLAAQPELVEAFRNEAELCARLLHPNIVQVLDFGRIEDTFFFAMEFIDGGTLADVIRRAHKSGVEVPARLCALVGREICRGLAFAHHVATDDEGNVLRVVHRDLNPPNVLVSRAGQVKLLDYGIATALRDADSTTTRTVAGKSGYMSPEQARGQKIDERCDVFAAAIILWELLCLRPLFKRDNDFATLNAMLAVQVEPPSSARPFLGSDWDDFFAKAFAKHIDDRYQSANEMGEALDALMEGEGFPHPSELQEFLRTLPELPDRRAPDRTVFDARV